MLVDRTMPFFKNNSTWPNHVYLYETVLPSFETPHFGDSSYLIHLGSSYSISTPQSSSGTFHYCMLLVQLLEHLPIDPNFVAIISRQLFLTGLRRAISSSERNLQYILGSRFTQGCLSSLPYWLLKEVLT